MTVIPDDAQKFEFLEMSDLNRAALILLVSLCPLLKPPYPRPFFDLERSASFISFRRSNP